MTICSRMAGGFKPANAGRSDPSEKMDTRRREQQTGPVLYQGLEGTLPPTVQGTRGTGDRGRI